MHGMYQLRHAPTFRVGHHVSNLGSVVPSACLLLAHTYCSLLKFGPAHCKSSNNPGNNLHQTRYEPYNGHPISKNVTTFSEPLHEMWSHLSPIRDISTTGAALAFKDAESLHELFSTSFPSSQTERETGIVGVHCRLVLHTLTCDARPSRAEQSASHWLTDDDIIERRALHMRT